MRAKAGTSPAVTELAGARFFDQGFPHNGHDPSLSIDRTFAPVALPAPLLPEGKVNRFALERPIEFS